jgi:hypothetical protein
MKLAKTSRAQPPLQTHKPVAQVVRAPAPAASPVARDVERYVPALEPVAVHDRVWDTETHPRAHAVPPELALVRVRLQGPLNHRGKTATRIIALLQLPCSPPTCIQSSGY